MDLVKILVQGDFIATIDIKDVYRAISIHPVGRPHQAIQWDWGTGKGPELFFDNPLCMRLSSSPYIFNHISDFVVCCAAREGVCRGIIYLDDFAVLGYSACDCMISQMKIVSIIWRLGFYLSYPKVVASSQDCRLLGIDIDTILLQLRLPPDTLIKLKEQLCQFLGKHKSSCKELGHLAHCATLVRGGSLLLHPGV